MPQATYNKYKSVITGTLQYLSKVHPMKYCYSAVAIHNKKKHKKISTLKNDSSKSNEMIK